MAYNLGCGCYAASVFNAFAPFKYALLGDETIEVTAIRSKGHIMREIECGLIYVLGIKFIDNDLFLDSEGNPLLKFYIAPVLVSPEDIGAGSSPFIHIVGLKDTIEQTFMDKLIEMSLPNNYGQITSENLLKGILMYRMKYEYTAPIVITLNITNVHYITCFNFNSQPNTIYVVDDGHVYDLTINDVPTYHIVAAIEVFDEKLSSDSIIMSAMHDIYMREVKASVPIHEIDFNIETKKMSIKLAERVNV